MKSIGAGTQKSKLSLRTWMALFSDPKHAKDCYCEYKITNLELPINELNTANANIIIQSLFPKGKEISRQRVTWGESRLQWPHHGA